MSKRDLDDFGGLLNWEALQDWINRNDVPGSGAVTCVERLSGGTQNNVFLISRGAGQFVLRRPSLHLRSNSNATILREARVLRALAGSDVPHPRVFAVCEDPGVIGACFYAMAPLEGFTPWGDLPGRYGADRAWRHSMGGALVHAAAALGALDYRAIGLSDLGKADDWHARQVPRWRSQLEGYKDLPNYPGHSLPFVDEIGQWLLETVPADQRIGVIHGDLNICNAMFSLRSPRVSGIIDWELSTLGDPMLDLGWILASWSAPGDPEGQSPLVSPWDGFMSRAELVRLYCEASGRDMSSASWFFVLACFKLACILEGNHARAWAGQAPKDIGERHHARAQWLMTKARQVKNTSEL